MQPQTIVVGVDEFFQMSGKLVEIRILVAVDFFLFQGLHKAFTSRVVVGIGWTAHARDHLAGLENRSVFGARILGALIGVMHYSRRRLTPADGLLQCRHRPLWRLSCDPAPNRWPCVSTGRSPPPKTRTRS